MKRTEEKTPKQRGQSLLSFIFPVLLGAVIGIGVVIYSDMTSLDFTLSLILFAALTVIALIEGVIIHEAGHLVFGLYSGYSFLSFRIFSLTVIRTEAGFRFALINLPGTAGQCLMSPPELKDGKMPVILYNLGGSIMNIIFSAVFFFLFAITLSRPQLSLVFFIHGAVSLALALMNGIPMKTQAIANDADNALTLSRDEGLIRAMWVQMKVAEQNTLGVRLKDMPEEWFDIDDTSYSTTLGSSVAFFAAERLLDMHRFAEAELIFARLASDNSATVGIYRALVANERYFIELMGECRPDVASLFVTDGDKKFIAALKGELSVMRTEYARLCLVDKNEEKAALTEARFNKKAQHAPYPQDAISEGELMDLIRSRCAKSKESTK